MFLLIIIILTTLLIGIISYFSLESLSTWRHIKASKLNFNYLLFLYYYISLLIKNIPPDLIFDVLVDEHIAEIKNPVKELIKYYKSLASRVNKLVDELDKSYSNEEIVLKRVGGYYILTGDSKTIFKRLFVALKTDINITVLGTKNNSAEKKKYEFLQTLFKTYQKKIEKIKDSLLLKEEKDGKNKEEKELETVEENLKRDLLSDLRANRIYLYKAAQVKNFQCCKFKFKLPVKVVSKEIKQLKKDLFKTTSHALIKAKRANYDISYNKLEVHLGLNGDIEQSIEILLKTKNLGLDVSLEDIEKYILAEGDIQEAAALLVDAQNAGLQLKLRSLEKYHLLGGNIAEVVNALILANQEGIKEIRIELLTEYLSQGGNVTDLTFAIIKLRQANIDITVEELNRFRASGVNVINFASALVKAKQSGIEINLPRLRSFLAQQGDVVELMNTLIKTKNAELNLKIEDYEDLHRAGVPVKLAFSTFKLNKAFKLPFSKEELMDAQYSNNNMFALVDAVALSKRLKLDADISLIKTIVNAKIDAKKLIFAVKYAKKQNIDLSLSKAFHYEKDGVDINEALKWAIEPQLIHVVSDPILSKDGISMRVHVDVKVKGKIDLFRRGAKEDVIALRVKEALAKKIEEFTTFDEVIKSLGNIALYVFKRLNGILEKDDFKNKISQEEIDEINKKEIKLNEGNAFLILDVSVPNIDLGSETDADLKKEQAEISKIIAKTESERRKALAHAQEAEAKAKLIESKANINDGMAHAFKKGKLSTNDLLKKELLHEDKKDIFGNIDEGEH